MLRFDVTTVSQPSADQPSNGSFDISVTDMNKKENTEYIMSKNDNIRGKPIKSSEKPLKKGLKVNHHWKLF